MPSQRDDRALRDAVLDACIAAARVGATYIRSRSGDLATIDWQAKSRADFVSEVDVGAESRIADVLQARFPDAAILGEELSPAAATSHGLAFIVDPLDGTTNFLHGYPEYAVSIGAVVGDELLAGVVLEIPRDITYAASSGGGAYRNGQRMSVSAIHDPSRALVGTGFPFKHPEQIAPYLPQFARVMATTAGVRRAGSAALDLAHVACGHFDAFWELMLAPWDIAAGILLVREAGGRVTDLKGVDARPSQTPVVASNGALHDWMMEQLSS